MSGKVMIVRDSLKVARGSGVNFYPTRRAIVVRDGTIKNIRSSGVTFTISGTVKTSLGVGLSRRVIAYRGGSETVVHVSAQSDGAGNFSMTANGNRNDEFKVEVIGIEGENTECFDHVRPG